MFQKTKLIKTPGLFNIINQMKNFTRKTLQKNNTNLQIAMKTSILSVSKLYLFVFVILVLFSCEKKEKSPLYQAAVLGTVGVSDIKPSEVKVLSEVTASSANTTVSEYGFCYDEKEIVGIETSKKVALGTAATDKQAISTTLTGLKPNTKYFVRAYLTDAKQTNFSAQANLTTASLQAPKVTTTDGSEITNTTFAINGRITELGTSDVTEYGHVLSETVKEPTLADMSTKLGKINTAPKDFKSVFSSLKAGISYYVRAYATNITGTSYSEVKTVKTLNPIPPTVESSDLGSYGPTKVSAYGAVTAFGSNATITEYGFVISASNQNPTTTDTKANKTGTLALKTIFQIDIKNLQANTNYYLRAYATTADGTGYGKVLTYKTPDYTPPTFGAIPQPLNNYCGSYMSDWVSRKIDFTKPFDGYCWGGTSFQMPPQVNVSFTYTASPDDEMASMGICIIPNSTLYLIGTQPTVSDNKID